MTFFQVVGEMFLPSTEGFINIYRLDGAFEMALTLAALAGLSEAVGWSALLFMNRIRLRRFILSLFISAGIFVITYLFLAVSISMVARLAYGAEVGLRSVATVVGLSYAPRLFGFVAFVPYFGVPLAVLLNLWTILVMMESVAWGLGLAPAQALFSILAGGLLLFTMQRSVGRPVTAVARWAMHRAAGVPLVTDPQGFNALLDSRPDTGLRSTVLKDRYRPPSARLGPRKRT